MSRPPRIVITGHGYVGASGSGREGMAMAFERGVLPCCEVDSSAGYHRQWRGRPMGARRAALVPATALEGWIPPRQLRRMSPPSRFAVAAARQAALMAGGDPAAPTGQTAVVSSTAYGPSSFTEGLLRQIFLDQPTAASPFLFTEAVANAPAAQIALALEATGPNLTITQREAGPLLAVARAAREIVAGRAERAVAVAVDEANFLLHAALDRYGALAGSRGGEEVGRPFDAGRRGVVLAEGATAYVLEGERQARARGVTGPLWAVRGNFSGFDPVARPTSWGRGHGPLAGAVLSGLQRFGLEPADIDAVVCGAAGSVRGDAAEAALLRSVFGSRMPPVLTPKGHTGEHGGGLLAGLAWLLSGARWCRPPGFETPDPGCGVVPFGGASLAPRRVLAGALAVGGGAAWIVLEKLDR